MMLSNNPSTTASDKRVAVIVLNWNGKALLKQFAGNWSALTPQWADLIVVDNGSSDDSVSYLEQYHPEINVLSFSKNYGFAEGYTRAIARLDYPIVVLLNSDAVLHEGWLDQPLRLFEERSEIVAIQPKLRAFRSPQHFEYAGAAGGYLDALGYPYCAGRLFDNLEHDHNQYDSIRPLMWATGACLIVRRSAYLEVGGLDASFFAHQEEIDLCWRLRARGGEIVLAPESIVYHVGGGSLDSENPKKNYLNFRNNLLMLYKNMPWTRLVWVLALRLILDLVACLNFVKQSKHAHAMSVLRAWRDALSVLPKYRKVRQENLQKTIVPPKQILSPISIVWQYFVLGRKTYSSLR